MKYILIWLKELNGKGRKHGYNQVLWRGKQRRDIHRHYFVLAVCLIVYGWKCNTVSSQTASLSLQILQQLTHLVLISFPHLQNSSLTMFLGFLRLVFVHNMFLLSVFHTLNVPRSLSDVLSYTYMTE